MGLSIYNIRKWLRMLTGKSEMHVHQTMGKQFVPGQICGYFNNMTEKVLMEPQLVDNQDLPMNHAEQGDVIFPVTIFQYALGCYDFYLENGDNRFLRKFMQLARWAIDNQNPDGSWNNFGFIYPTAPYGSMCQGEGASVLVRAYKESNDKQYLLSAIKSIDFMLKSIEDGGTSVYQDQELVFLEYTHLPAVLNGWIFSIFGLYDLELISSTPQNRDKFARTIETLISKLPEFDCNYWSMYDLGGKIASPFYHELHISQLEALYLVTQNHVFKDYQEKFRRNRSSRLCTIRAFIKKAYQKVKE